jgi:nucleotide-binding universal stress UspA family protein
MSPTKIILCPVDFSKGSEHAVRKAQELARATGSELELLHVYSLPVLALPDAAIMVSPTYVAELTERAEQALEVHRKMLADGGVSVHTKLVEGSPADAIVERAKNTQAHMIVMGTHGRGGFRRFLLGSVAERVVRMAEAPVLTVHLPPE